MASVTAGAARRSRTAPKPAPKAAPKRQPDLRVVRAAATRRRRRLAAVLTTLFVAGGLFGVAAFHVLIAQNQFRLDEIEEQAVVEQAKYERLRLQVAELESPARIVAAAQQRLGMVPPPGVRYLSPAGVAGGTIAGSSPAADESDDDDHRGGAVATAGTGWSTVKPHLGSNP